MLRIIGGKEQVVEFQSYASVGGNPTSFSFTGQAIGDADSDRVVVVGVTNVSSSSSGFVTGMTIGGVTATFQGRSGPFPWVELWSAVVPTGTTATVSGSIGAPAIDFTIGIWACYGLRQTVTPFNVATLRQSTTGLINLVVPSRGLATVIAKQRTSNASQPKGITWSFPEQVLSVTGDFISGSGSSSGCHADKMPANATMAIQGQPASVNVTIVGATWR